MSSPQKLERRLLWLAVAAALAGWVLTRESGKLHPEWRAAMALVGAAGIAARAWLGGSRRVIATVLLTVWAAGIVGWMVGRPLERLADDHAVRDWSWFHYYLGSKYFEEIGYRDLYDQTVAVDRERDQKFSNLKDIRDLRTYLREPMNYHLRERSPAWTGDRWADFSEDVQWFMPRFAPRDWKRVLRDRGYNATPTGTAIYRMLSRAPLETQVLALLGALDPLLLLLAFAFAGRVFGTFKALLAAAWMLLFYGNEFHVVGGPLLYDYVAALIAMAAAAHSNRPRLAGVLLGYAAMVRAFPALLLLSLLVWAIARWRRDGAMPTFAPRFAQGVAAAVVLGFVAGAVGPRGPKAWTEWSDNISMHSEHHRFGNKRIGLQHAFTQDVNLGTEWRLKEWRRRTWPKQRGAWAVAALAMIGLWLVATWRSAGRDPLDALVLSLAVIFAGLVLSRYYVSVACLLFLLGGRERDGPREGLIGAGLFLLTASLYLLAPLKWPGFGQYVAANLGWALFWVLLLVATLRWPTVPQAPGTKAA